MLRSACAALAFSNLREVAMPRVSWRGHLRLSLVSCPIYLLPATVRTKPLRLHQVWRSTPINRGERSGRDDGRGVPDQAEDLLEQDRDRAIPDRPAPDEPADEVENRSQPGAPATRITLRPHDPATGEEIE